MTQKTKYLIGAVVALGVLTALNSVYHFSGGHGRAVNKLIAKNVAARGGAENWKDLDSLRLSGQMDLGQGMYVPYVMEQKRSGKMCLEFVFDEQTATQCVNGDTGWKRLPFRGRSIPEEMTELELHELADSADIDGLLFNSAERGYEVDLVGKEKVRGKLAAKLQVTLPGGAVRWVYVDDETGLEIKREYLRTLRGEQHLVETYYLDWRETDGLLIPRRQETIMEGDNEPHFLTVDSVRRNPLLDDSRFAMPAVANGAST